MPPFKLAHLSDLHLGPLIGLNARTITLKRLFGAYNWHANRKRGHRPDVAAQMAAAVLEHAPDHIAVSGDLVNLGLPAEILRAGEWLGRLGAAERVSLVPGNHDHYQPFGHGDGFAPWQPSMMSDAGGRRFLSRDDSAFPYVRVLVEPVAGQHRGLAIVALNSAEPKPLFNASGRLGQAQLAATEAALRSLAASGFMRVVMIHHPPLPGLGSHVPSPPEDGAAIAKSDARRGLNDAAAFRDMLIRVGAELVLHGHNHAEMLNFAPGPDGADIPIVGAASLSLAEPKPHENPAGANLFTLHLAHGTESIHLSRIGLDISTGAITTRPPQRIRPPT